MREVQRLANRVLVIWGLFDGLTFDQWVRVNDPAIRQALLLAEEATVVDPVHMGRGQLRAEWHDTYRPAVPNGSPVGAAWDIAAYFYDAHTYTTDSQNLEQDDVCVDGDHVRWHDDTGIHHEPATRVTVDRDGTSTVTRVRKT